MFSFLKVSSIRFKMIAIFLPIVLLATLSITTMNYLDMKKEVTHQIEQRVSYNLNELVQVMEGEFAAHSQGARAIASFYQAKGNTLSKEDYRKAIEQILTLNQNTLGIGIWLEPYTYSQDTRYFGPYIYKDGQSFVYTEDYEAAEYDYPSTDWYKIGKEARGGVGWSDPYYDETSDITMITAAVPFENGGQFEGVVSADYDLSVIQDIIRNVSFERTGYAFLVNGEGQFIAHQDQDKVMKQTITEDTDLKVLGEELLANERGSKTLNINGQSFSSYYVTFPSTGWKLVIMAPYKELYRSVEVLVYKSILVTGFIILIAALLIYLFSLKLSKGIERFAGKFGFLAEGDFTQSVDINAKDEIGQMAKQYNAVLDNLRGMVIHINSSSDSVAATAEELSVSTEETARAVLEVAHATQAVATKTGEQNDYVKRMNQSTHEIHHQMGTVHQSIEDVKESAAHALGLSVEGNKHVDQVTDQMNQIDRQVEESANTIVKLNDKSQKIEEIISMITNIAKQTNLLALNAAIEAARAGEHGKGFAVVAEEVKSLADASSKSSGDISLLIQEIQQGIMQSAQVMQKSTQATRSGIEIVGRTGQTFGQISEAVKSVTTRIQELYHFASNISVQINEMKEMVEALSEIAISNDENAQSISAATEEQTAIVEQIREAANDLAQMSSQLQLEMSKFKV